jgi:hypothetical protein
MRSKKHIKQIKNKTYKKLKRLKKLRRIKEYNKTFFHMEGGMFGKLIGEGTHGKIYTLKNNHRQVVKVYANRSLIKKQKSLCVKIKKAYDSTCDELNYEYVIQNIVGTSFRKHRLSIFVPTVTDFNVLNSECFYVMDRIFPLEDKILFLDMTDPDISVNINTGKQLGYSNICLLFSITPAQLSYLIGKMFSLLHFLLKLDGYDCELIVGRENELSDEPTFYFIDFDKVSCFEFNSDQVLYRKISEEYVEEKEIKSPKKLASFLFGALISMSLLPIDRELKEHFLEGYRTYFNGDTDEVNMMMNEMIVLIEEYEI